MTDVELRAVKERAAQLKDYMPASERWRADEMEANVKSMLAYIQHLEWDVAWLKDKSRV